MTFEHIMNHQTGVSHLIMMDNDKPDNRFVIVFKLAMNIFDFTNWIQR